MRWAGTRGTRAALLTLGAAVALAGGRAAYADGAVVAWGYNSAGQCNPPAALASVTQIAGKGEHTIALKSDGTVACWGWNAYGQCDIPAGLASVTQIAGGYYHTLALKGDATVACWGYNSFGQCNAPAGLAPVTAVAANRFHTVVRLDTDCNSNGIRDSFELDGHDCNNNGIHDSCEAAVEAHVQEFGGEVEIRTRTNGERDRGRGGRE